MPRPFRALVFDEFRAAFVIFTLLWMLVPFAPRDELHLDTPLAAADTREEDG